MLGAVALAQYLLRTRVSILLLLAGALFMFTANQWYMQAQVRADGRGLDLAVNNPSGPEWMQQLRPKV
jgi:hypothetical protein